MADGVFAFTADEGSPLRETLSVDAYSIHNSVDVLDWEAVDVKPETAFAEAGAFVHERLGMDVFMMNLAPLEPVYDDEVNRVENLYDFAWRRLTPDGIPVNGLGTQVRFDYSGGPPSQPSVNPIATAGLAFLRFRRHSTLGDTDLCVPKWMFFKVQCVNIC